MRYYKKKEKSYSKEELKRAILDVKNSQRRIRKAAKDLGISHDTLRRKIIANVDADQIEDKRGKKTVLTADEEAKLASYLRTLAKWGFGLIKEELLCIVSDYCKQSNTPNTFRGGKPGQEWFTNFCRRNNIKIKNTERLEKNRQKNTSDPFLIYEFYDLLEKLATELNLQNKPEHWWNLDECGVCHDPTKSKALAGKEQTNVYRTDQGPGRENTTVMACVSASGRKLAPLFIFKAAKLWSTWKGTEDIPGTFYAVAENGFITSDIFYGYLEKFCRTVKERPLILVVDGHVSHLDLRSVELAKKENVAVVKLSSHTTDLLQPLDRTCFGPFKKRWNAALVEWQRLNQRPLIKSEFVNLVCKVWGEGLSELNIVSGFRACGIYPLNREKYPINRLNPTKLQTYLALREDGTSAVCGAPTSDTQPLTIHVPAPDDLELPIQLDIDGVVIDEIGSGGEKVIGAIDDTSEVIVLPSSVPMVSDAGQSSVLFEELLLKKLGTTPAPKEKRRMIPSNAAVITSEEFVSKLQEISKDKKQTQCTKRKNVPTDNTQATKRRRGKENVAPPNSTLSAEEENTESVGEGHFIVARIDGKKEVCRIDKVHPNLEDAIVMWFSKVEGEDTEDTYEMAVPCLIKFTDVVKKLSSPTLLQNGSRVLYVFESAV